MTHEHEIPIVRIRTPRARWWMMSVGLVLGVLAVRHLVLVLDWNRYRSLTLVWTAYFALSAFQWALAWLERPVRVGPGAQASLDRLRVTVCIPVFNEDPEVLDRVLFAVLRQTRLPDKVEVVDDGSRVDYDEVRTYWQAHHPTGVEFSWIRQENRGKKEAHARTFRGDPADVFVTLDSDTVLEVRALAEGLKPFGNPRVQSVAGLELAWNQDRNVVTRLNSARQLVWQLVTCSAQNVARGNVLINRGTFALYRGELVRDVVDAYAGEMFGRHRIMLGDDTFLTTIALSRGRAVQQPSAVCLTMYPENLSHHLRQWTRWMRGTTLRTFWRLRYLRPGSWAFLYSFLTLWWYVASLAITGVLVATWPRSANYSRAMIAIGALWALLMATRCWVVRRSDQSPLGRLGVIAIAPLASLWVILVLRMVRVYGTFTFLRQGWTTRSEVEVRADSAPLRWPGPRPAEAPLASSQLLARPLSERRSPAGSTRAFTARALNPDRTNVP